MSASTRSGRSAVLLRGAVALTLIVTWAGGQVIDIRPCRNYQSAYNFNRDYVAKLVSQAEGHSLLLTSQQPGSSSCERLTLRTDKTFLFSYSDLNGTPHNHSGRFAVQQASFTDPGYIDLAMPPTVFGAPLFGHLRLFVIVAEEDFFVVTSCQNIGLISVERVHVFVETPRLNDTSAVTLNTSLAEMGVPHVNLLREVRQNCSPDIRAVTPLSSYSMGLYNFLSLLGIVVPLPPRVIDPEDDSEDGSETDGNDFSKFFTARASLTQFLRRLSNPNMWLAPSPEPRHALNGLELPSDTQQWVLSSSARTPLTYSAVRPYRAHQQIYQPAAVGYLPAAAVFSPAAVGFSPAGDGFSTAGAGFSPAAAGFLPAAAGFSPAAAEFSQAIAGFSPATAGFSPAAAGFSPAIAGFSPAIAGFSPADINEYSFLSSAPSYRQASVNYFPPAPNQAMSSGNYHQPLPTNFGIVSS